MWVSKPEPHHLSREESTVTSRNSSTVASAPNRLHLAWPPLRICHAIKKQEILTREPPGSESTCQVDKAEYPPVFTPEGRLTGSLTSLETDFCSV